ncbi:hypothetical protein K1719_020729 [Acacia pycnantha]|nr:hypothetical protein K1719_020729 [Acacia pycnantha]
MTGLASTTTSAFHYHWTYDVFISFRGEDTRYGFTGNLNHALTQKGVRTFFDDKEIRKGDEITPKLLKAIKESRMAIIVFSENYASSTFCLDELVQICQCIKHKDRLVWPIFYNVEPSEVRHQKGKYGQALAMHKNNLRASEEKIQSWKLALYEVSNISGTHFNTRHDYEYQVVERIVEDIFRIINRALLHIAEYPVGLDSRLQNINSLLQLELKDKVIMVGIFGMGGVGKTTIARALYNSMADNFEGLCFLHDIRENQEKIGLEKMQERMLSKILGVEIKIDDVNEGIAIIKERLKQKKILLILDNVYEHEQLRKFAGSCDWFGPGSRIVITTRDKRLLVRHGVERTYDMEAFNYEESLELLRWNAFKTLQVDPSYKEVVDTVICYAQGLPLALEVVSSHLCACFFKGNELEYVEDMVKHAHGFDPLYSIQVLVDKCLIKIEKDWFSSKFNCIEMHDLIQNMGREIVRQESPYEAGKRSRLWFHQDIIDIFEENTGTNKVRMIVQDNWRECIEVNWDGEAFKSMKELKILIFENVKFSEDPKYLPKSLKVLKWKGYSSSCLPPNFSPKKLVVLDIEYSCLSSLETIIKTSSNLGILNLKDCEYVKEILDLSNLRNLKEFSLIDCKNLIGIHDSVGYLPYD